MAKISDDNSAPTDAALIALIPGIRRYRLDDESRGVLRLLYELTGGRPIVEGDIFITDKGKVKYLGLTESRIQTCFEATDEVTGDTSLGFLNLNPINPKKCRVFLRGKYHRFYTFVELLEYRGN